MYFNFNNNNNRWIERDNKTTNQSHHDKTDQSKPRPEA